MNKTYPNDWKSLKFSDLFHVAIGGTPSRSNPDYWDEKKDTNNKWLSIRDIKGKYIYDTTEYLSDAGVKNSNVKLVPKGTVMMSFKLTVGRCAYAGADLYTNEAIAAFIPKKVDLIDLGYFFQGLHFWDLLGDSDQAVKGVTLNKEKINDLHGLFPPLPEQQKIAAILTSVDDVIETTQAQINKLKDLKTGMMQELLTKGIGRGGLPYTEFKDSPVGTIPKAWSYVKVDSVVTKVGSGITPQGGSAVYTQTGIPFIRSQNVYGTGLRWDDICFISDDQHRKMSNSQLKPNDVLLNITGASIGRCYYLPADFKEGNVNQHVCIIRVRENVLNHIFLSHFINSEYGQQQIMSLQAGGNREGLNFQQIRAIGLPLPTIEEQLKISEIVSSVERKIFQKTKKMNAITSIKKALMQDLLTGKVRVKVS